jgi:hypothetical protein
VKYSSNEEINVMEEISKEVKKDREAVKKTL